MKIGIFGGSFDPIHAGHSNVIRRVKKLLHLEKLVVMPVHISPFKTDNPPIASGVDRIAMASLVFSDDDKIEVSDAEVQNKTISYTVNTVLALSEKYPKDDLFLILTDESSSRFTQWQEYQEILELTQVVIVSKDGLRIWGKEVLESSTIPWIDISSTRIRNKLAKGEGCQEFLSSKVLDYIRQHKLYS